MNFALWATLIAALFGLFGILERIFFKQTAPKRSAYEDSSAQTDGGRAIDPEDLAVWPDGTYCTVDEVEMFMTTVGLSDDYRIVPYDSEEALLITG